MDVLVELSIKKVNGWNIAGSLYTIMHYALNMSSIIFSCISVYFSFSSKNELSILSTIIALLTLTCNLFLRCDRKWATFRRVLSEGRILTNKFISDFKSSSELNKITCEYANEIIRLEQSLKDSDLS